MFGTTYDCGHTTGLHPHNYTKEERTAVIKIETLSSNPVRAPPGTQSTPRPQAPSLTIKTMSLRQHLQDIHTFFNTLWNWNFNTLLGNSQLDPILRRVSAPRLAAGFGFGFWFGALQSLARQLEEWARPRYDRKSSQKSFPERQP